MFRWLETPDQTSERKAKERQREAELDAKIARDDKRRRTSLWHSWYRAS